MRVSAVLNLSSGLVTAQALWTRGVKVLRTTRCATVHISNSDVLKVSLDSSHDITYLLIVGTQNKLISSTQLWQEYKTFTYDYLWYLEIKIVLCHSAYIGNTNNYMQNIFVCFVWSCVSKQFDSFYVVTTKSTPQKSTSRLKNQIFRRT